MRIRGPGHAPGAPLQRPLAGYPGSVPSTPSARSTLPLSALTSRSLKYSLNRRGEECWEAHPTLGLPWEFCLRFTLSSRCPICVPLFQELRSCIASWAIRGVGFKLIWVGQEAENRKFGVRVLPTVFVVGADGVVRHVLEGKRGDQSIMGLISLKLEEIQSTQGD